MGPNLHQLRYQFEGWNRDRLEAHCKELHTRQLKLQVEQEVVRLEWCAASIVVWRKEFCRHHGIDGFSRYKPYVVEVVRKGKKRFLGVVEINAEVNMEGEYEIRIYYRFYRAGKTPKTMLSTEYSVPARQYKLFEDGRVWE